MSLKLWSELVDKYKDDEHLNGIIRDTALTPVTIELELAELACLHTMMSPKASMTMLKGMLAQGPRTEIAVMGTIMSIVTKIDGAISDQYEIAKDKVTQEEHQRATSH